MFRPIGTPPLHRAIQQQIKAYILDNGLGPGDRLPTETEMSAQLKVSRNVLREALKALEAIGLVEVHMGSGTFVASFDPVKYMDSFTHNLLVEGMGIDEMWDVRQALEFAFIRRAAERIGDEDLEQLDALLVQLEDEFARGEYSTVTSLRMHPVIYRCLNNRFLNSFLDSYVEFFSRVYQPIFEPEKPEMMELTLQIHRDLVDALRQHDGDAAVDALRRDFPAVTLSIQLASRYARQNHAAQATVAPTNSGCEATVHTEILSASSGQALRPASSSRCDGPKSQSG